MNSAISAENLAEKARESISGYCSRECKSYCCRKGYLLLTENERDLVIAEKTEKLLRENILTLTKDKRYLLNLSPDGCPRLKDFKCELHDNPDRPKACKEFPVFMWENKKINISQRCPASKENLFYAFLAEFRKLGYTEK
jgi:Fe-S-cluster containining protein